MALIRKSPAPRTELLPGTLDMLILQTLRRSEMHGYGIVSAIQRASDDELGVVEGALYPALHRLQGRRRRHFHPVFRRATRPPDPAWLASAGRPGNAKGSDMNITATKRAPIGTKARTGEICPESGGWKGESSPNRARRRWVVRAGRWRAGS